MTVAFYDFETTGLNPFHDKIIEYAFLSDDEQINSFIKRPTQLSPEVQKVTGITFEMLQGSGIHENRAKEDILDWLKKMCIKNERPIYLVAHNNIGFDMIFLKRLLSDEPEFIKNNIRFVDSMYLAKYLMPKMRSVSMKTLTKVFGIESGNHRALGDTIALKKVYGELIKKLPVGDRNIEKIYNMLNIV